jgi:L-fuculose-phosphate aldolase
MLPEFTPDSLGSRERELRKQIIEIVQRACDRHLMISTEGVVSARLDESAFLITPTGIDRRSMDIEDVVLVRQGRREQGKSPSRSVLLHRSIYALHPDIGSIITAQAPNATAYAIVSEKFDTKTIPESYILLLDIPKIPFNMFYGEPERTATRLSARTPVVIAENDCVMTTGATILQAFDRLEVAEFSAKALIDTATKLGKLAPIGDRDIQDIETAFGLS